MKTGCRELQAYACVVAFLLASVAVQTDATWKKGTRSGKVVWGEKTEVPKVEGAVARVFMEFTKKGVPVSSGIKFARKFIDNRLKLPCFLFTKEPGLEKSCASLSFLEFPKRKNAPFSFMELDFTTGGHEPVGIYNISHFDIHFYLISKDELVRTLDPNTTAGPCPPQFNPATFKKVHAPIPTKCYPKGFSNLGASVPLMGNHLINISGPEFIKPGSFDETFIYGSFGGKITFLEPMTTAEVLLRANWCRKIPSLPKEFPKAGYYPTTYCIYTYKKSIYVELRDYKWKKAGCKHPKSYDGYLPPNVVKNLPPQCVVDQPRMGK